MRRFNPVRGALAVLALVALLALEAGPARAQANCLSFGEARRAGWLAGARLRPAAAVKKAVEARTGGKVVSFEICRPGPVYRLRVLRPDGKTFDVDEPAQ